MQVPEGGIVFVRRARADEIPVIHELTKQEITADIAPISVVEDVYNRNRDGLWTVKRASDLQKTDAPVYVAPLLLGEIGRDRLEKGDFDAHEPDPRLIVPDFTRPAAIYVWAIIAPRLGRQAANLIAHAMGADLYAGVPLFATAGTLRGMNLMKGYGFGAQGGKAALGQLFRLDQARTAVVQSSSAA